MFSLLHGAPAKRISPSMVPVFLRRASTSIRLVFPQPLAPKRAVRRPGLKQPLMPSRITFVPCFLPRSTLYVRSLNVRATCSSTMVSFCIVFAHDGAQSQTSALPEGVKMTLLRLVFYFSRVK